MELSKYIVGEQLILILVPRFVRASEVSSMIFNYLTGAVGISRKVEMPDSDIIHFNPKDKSKSPDIYIFKSLIAMMKNRLDLKHKTSIVLLEWGFDENLLQELESRYRGGIRLLRLEFMHDPRVVNINILHIPMSTDFASWYYAITEKHDFPLQIKSVVGNHYYRDATDKERLDSLMDPNYMNLEHKVERHQPAEVSKIIENLKLVSNKDLITHPSALKGEDHYRSGEGIISEDSPKIHTIAKEFLKLPGKYLIVTSFQFAYGISIISSMLEKLLGVKPTVVSSSMKREDIDMIFDSFNESEKGQLGVIITSVVPTKPLKDITRVVIIDTYKVPFIINVLQSVCGYRCGSIENPLEVTLLTVQYPSYLQESTYEENAARRALEELSIYERRYDYMYRNSLPVTLEETSWNVTK